MILKEINEKYKTDKGVTHNYLDFYESMFKEIKENAINILEIGVLFGNSLKLWNDYFVNAKIYGIDDFSQTDGHDYYNFEIVDAKKIAENLSIHDRIKLFTANCEDENNINTLLQGLMFDIIIDDASHKTEQQKNNYKIYHKFLNENGLYFCEDVQTMDTAKEISNYIKNITPEKKVKIFNFNTEIRSDDRIILVK